MSGNCISSTLRIAGSSALAADACCVWVRAGVNVALANTHSTSVEHLVQHLHVADQVGREVRARRDRGRPRGELALDDLQPGVGKSNIVVESAVRLSEPPTS